MGLFKKSRLNLLYIQRNYVIDGFIQKPIAIKTLYNIVDSYMAIN